jgi:uncharacterized protein YndB with AHSA1/START domain
MNDDYAVLTAPDTIRLERILPGPIERAWEYLTDGEKRATWFAGGEMEPRVGGKVTLVFQNSKLTPGDIPPPPKHAGNGKPGMMACEITAWEPPRVLGFTMSFGPEASHVRFELTPQGRDVKLVVEHRRLVGRDLVLQISGGWHTHLAILVARLRGEAPPLFWKTHTRLEAEYAQRF